MFYLLKSFKCVIRFLFLGSFENNCVFDIHCQYWRTLSMYRKKIVNRFDAYLEVLKNCKIQWYKDNYNKLGYKPKVIISSTCYEDKCHGLLEYKSVYYYFETRLNKTHIYMNYSYYFCVLYPHIRNTLYMSTFLQTGFNYNLQDFFIK